MALNNGPRDFAAIPPDIRLVAFDETCYWNMEAFGKDAKLIKSILAVRLVDLNERTHICSITPSSYCVFVYHAVIYNPEVKVDDDASGRIFVNLIQNGEDDDYYDTATVERHCEIHENDPYLHQRVQVTQRCIDDAVESDPKDPSRGLMAILREYYQSNQPI